MIKTNTKSNRSITQGLIDKYSNGVLITDADWKNLTNALAITDAVQEKNEYLKSSKLIEKFICSDLDSFVLLTQQHNIMIRALINIYDYLKHANNEAEKPVILSDSHATEIINNVFADIEKVTMEQELYLTADL